MNPMPSTTSTKQRASKLDAGSVLNTTAKVHLGQGIMATLGVILGLVVCFFGYKLLRYTIFACGFAAGGLLAALVIESVFSSMSWVASASWIGFFVAGTIAGVVVLWLYNLGIFTIGAFAGILLAFTLNTSVGYKLYPSQPNVVLVVLLVVLGLGCGWLAWKLEKPVVILATAFIGATATFWGIGYFAGKYPSGNDVQHFAQQNQNGRWIYHLPGVWWAYLAATIVLFLAGVWIQWRRTAKGLSHRRNRAAAASEAEGFAQAATPV